MAVFAAVDGRQVFLQMICGRPESQYVNAVRVNGVTQRDAVIVTEHPLPCTLAHVWRMMYERKVCAWVILHHHPHHQQVSKGWDWVTLHHHSSSVN